mgnify:CR=1 FL=1
MLEKESMIIVAPVLPVMILIVLMRLTAKMVVTLVVLLPVQLPVMTVYMILPIMDLNAVIQHGMNLVLTVPL